MTSLNYPSLLSSRNLQAFLRTIREGESSQDDDVAYRMRYGGVGQAPKLFDAFDQHPRIFEPTPTGQVSSASGAYQIVATTWDSVCRALYDLGPDFTPYTQDCAAVALIHHRGALDDVIDGRFDQALDKLGNEWASLPGSSLQDGGSKIAYRRARETYVRWGGSFAEDVRPAPIEDAGRPAAPADVERINQQEEVAPMAPALILGLLGSLMEIFSPVLRAKLTKVLDKQTGDAAISGQVADKVIAIAQQAAAQVLPGLVPPPAASGVPASAAPIDPVIAIGAVKSNAALAAQVEAQVADYLEQLAPVLDRLEKLDQAAWEASESSMDRAAARAKGEMADMGSPLLYISAGLVGLLVLFACGIAGWQVIKTGAPSTEVWAQIAGLIGFGTGVWVTIVSYRFGTSRSSSSKDVVIAQLSRRT